MQPCERKIMDEVMKLVLTTTPIHFSVGKSFHEGWHCNKWCVWYDDQTFLCACETKREANKIADALNAL